MKEELIREMLNTERAQLKIYEELTVQQRHVVQWLEVQLKMIKDNAVSTPQPTSND